MKVTKHGKYFMDNMPKSISCSCPNCGCEFEFQKKDLVRKNCNINAGLVICPECNTVVRMISMSFLESQAFDHWFMS